MKKLLVRDLLTLSPTPPCVVRGDADARLVVERMLHDRSKREVYLVDEAGRFLGVIPLRRLAQHLFHHAVPDRTATQMLDLVSARNAGDLARKKVAVVRLDDHMDEVLDAMFRYHFDEVPVVDADGVVVGSLNMLDLVAAAHAGHFDEPRDAGATDDRETSG